MAKNRCSTIRDVAKIAKVSVATISRVINAPEMVKKETREKVLNAIKECKYVYNALAAGLSAQKTKTLGVIVPTITNPIFAMVIKGIQDYAAFNNYTTILGNTDYNEKIEQDLIQIFREKRVDGIILNGPWRNAPIVDHLKKARVPFVVTWQIIKDKNVNFVAFDNFKSAYRIVEYLISLGHKRIGMIAGKFSVSERALMRWKGYRKCLIDNNIYYDPKLLVEKNYSYSEGKDGLAYLLSISPPPTAIFCGNDILAIGALAYAKEIGIIVPRNLSIVGFDDMETSAYCDPPLTTISVPAYEMGQLAAKILIENIREEIKDPQQYILETKLIIRKSADRRDSPK